MLDLVNVSYLVKYIYWHLATDWNCDHQELQLLLIVWCALSHLGLSTSVQILWCVMVHFLSQTSTSYLPIFMQQLFYSHYGVCQHSQLRTAGFFSENSFTAHVPMLTATSTFWLRKTLYNSLRYCYLDSSYHYLLSVQKMGETCVFWGIHNVYFIPLLCFILLYNCVW